MNLWNKPLDEVEFDDVVSFCKEGHKEGVQLDYKDAMPSKGLSKHFASFSNTRGGLIILGVEEDRSTGLPKSYQGVADSAKIVQQIHQQSTNVEPSASYSVHATDEKSGRAFVLIRINEGTLPPYYVVNDPNIWVRTGDINDPINIASPNAVRLMFEKRADAKLARKNALDNAAEDFAAILKRMDAERLAAIAKERASFNKQRNAAIQSGNPLAEQTTFESAIYQGELGSQAANLSVSIQPTYPLAAITTPDKLKNDVTAYRVHGTYYGDLPVLARIKALPNGIYNPTWVSRNGRYASTQIYATGHVYDVQDVCDVKDDAKVLKLYYVAARLYMVLKCAANIYARYGYHGGLELVIKLEGVKDSYIQDIAEPEFDLSYSDVYQALLPQYEWRYELDTKILEEDSDFMRFYNSALKDIYWSLGNPDYSDAEIKGMLQQQGWTES